MEPITLLRTSSVLLAITAAGGVVMAAIRFGASTRNPPSWLAMLHGLLAASGLTLLAYAYFVAAVPGTAAVALLLFLFAAGGGVILNLGYHLKSAPLPVWLVLVHATIAVVAFILLLLAAWRG